MDRARLENGAAPHARGAAFLTIPRTLTLALALTLTPGAAAATSTEPLFDLPWACATPSLPVVFAVGDLNADGLPDLVFATQDQTLWVMLAVGGDRFGAPMSQGGGYTMRAGAICDLNGDGRGDLAMTTGPGVAVRLGNGDGTFGPRTDYAGAAESIEAADVDRDGRLDLVTCTGTSTTGVVSVLLGNGDGTFRPRIDSPAGAFSRQLALGDLNGDGNPDAVVVNAGSNTISVLLGNGDGSFRSPSPIWMGAPYGVAIGDFDGDHHLDLATITYTYPEFPPSPDDPPTNKYSVVFGNGDGTFSGRILFGKDLNPLASPAATDLNRDGCADLMAFDDEGISVTLGNADRTFAVPRGFPVPLLNAASPRFIDVNADGAMDFITLHQCPQTGPYDRPTGDVFVALGSPEGSFRIGTSYAVGKGPQAAVVTDLNEDAIPDLVVPNIGDSTVTVLLGLGDGSFAPGTAFPVRRVPTSVVAGDVDGDGHTDLVVAEGVSNGTSPKWASVLYGDGTGNLGARVDLPVLGSYTSTSLALSDLNADGRADLVMTSGPQLSVILGDGARMLSHRADQFLSGWLTWVGTADLNADAKVDLVALRFLASGNCWDQGITSVFLGNGDGTFGARSDRTDGRDLSRGQLVDYDGDGLLDLTYIDSGPWGDCVPSSSSFRVQLGNGDGTFRAPIQGATSGILVDVDGDGLLDAVGSYGGCGFSGFSVFRGHGNGTFDSRSDYAAMVGELAFGDLNRDGRLDVVAPGGIGVLVMLNRSPDVPTATLLSLFAGEWNGTGVELRWQFGDPSRWTKVSLERSAAANGPWATLPGESRESNGVMQCFDASAGAGRTWYYRLFATAHDGSTMTFGPLAVTAGELVREFGFTAVAPNPAQHRVNLEFAVPRAGRVELSVLDVQGRRVARLEDAALTPGHYQAVWDGATGNGRAAAGVYFARLDAEGRHWLRRFTWMR